MVRQLNGSWLSQTTVGGSINNALCISNHPRSTDNLSDTRLLVSNNDETIKIYNLPSLQRITTLGLPTAVNYASVSNDGRRLCAVGDSNQVFIYDITTSGFYQRVATLNGTNDAGFSCSWNNTSDKVAVASQDGFVTVWDIRYIHTNAHSSGNTSSVYPSTSSNLSNLLSPMSSPFSALSSARPGLLTTATQNPRSQNSISNNGNTSPGTSGVLTASTFLQRDSTKLACIASTQNPQVKGAIRAVKFSPSHSVDLLAFSEHVSYVNFVDARNFDGKQSIRVAPSGSDMHISGFSWSPDCKSVFVGLESTVLEYDVDIVSRRTFPRGSLI
jgi:hypothetical protein